MYWVCIELDRTRRVSAMRDRRPFSPLDARHVRHQLFDLETPDLDKIAAEDPPDLDNC